MSNIELQLGVLPPCAHKVYNIVKGESLKIHEIINKTTYTPRSVRTALKLLEERKLIEKIYDLNDLRSFYFSGK
ncbi:MAG: hypothetical protein HeimC3_31980 [Candidatus Heimdallarchaeota archaeon LC_3]|nr:MAG: hypothetical protein HeimC3_31980 [Candidatus Heimdallarchaeota archaeon LC_3]